VGVGLGLPLSRTMANRLGGTVRLDTSYAGPGARFEVEIPIHP
jgi:signal transduction histidine kinase